MHLSCVVIPKGHNEDHTASKRVRHGLHAALGSVVVLISEDLLDILAHFIGNRVDLLVKTVDLRLRMFDLLTVLDKESLDLNNISVLGTILRNELSDNSEWLIGIDSHAWAEEV